ncbi:hypothetical protein [Sphingomonas profundi]|uniref:hypothetical protein n=1 Tax=Alterirhizorhabdus profundi TaxID=2681549 RepID=UPI0012E6FB13|nr:hypothetical protein [Sphingomonas profundi]
MTANDGFGQNRDISLARPCRLASFAQLLEGEPQRIEPNGAPTWIARGANFVVAASRVEAGDIVAHHGIPDESMLLLTPAVAVAITAAGDEATVTEEALAILPPGDTRIVAASGGVIVRIFSIRAEPFAALAVNAADYGAVDDVAPLTPLPPPPDGYRLRLYRLRDYSEDVGFGRIFRSSNLMVNIFEPSAAARDLSRLSPHEHADFEQGSLTLGGSFVHYLRTPWVADRSAWRPDRFLECAGCSLVVIPPRMIHTTSWSTGNARLIDIFAPPRADFSAKRRWVRNAADYPWPDVDPAR